MADGFLFCAIYEGSNPRHFPFFKIYTGDNVETFILVYFEIIGGPVFYVHRNLYRSVFFFLKKLFSKNRHIGYKCENGKVTY